MTRKLLPLIVITVILSAAATAEKVITLPQPDVVGKYPLESSISLRRSHRAFENKELAISQVSQLVWAGQGITDRDYGFRAAPSAGALYPLTLYVVKSDGVFRYLPDGHKLVQIATEDKRPELVRAALGQGFIREAPVIIVVTANFRITEAKFGARTFRYVCMEAGHAAENIELQAAAMGLGAVSVASFWDDVVKKSLGLPDQHNPLYLIPIGYKGQ